MNKFTITHHNKSSPLGLPNSLNSGAIISIAGKKVKVGPEAVTSSDTKAPKEVLRNLRKASRKSLFAHASGKRGLQYP